MREPGSSPRAQDILRPQVFVTPGSTVRSFQRTFVPATPRYAQLSTNVPNSTTKQVISTRATENLHIRDFSTDFTVESPKDPQFQENPQFRVKITPENETKPHADSRQVGSTHSGVGSVKSAPQFHFSGSDSVSHISYQSSPVRPVPCPTNHENVTFSWSDSLDDTAFSDWLMRHVLPVKFQADAMSAYTTFGNVRNLNDLIYNFEFLSLDAVVSLFPSKHLFIHTVDGLVVLILLTKAIISARTTVTSHVQSEHIHHVYHQFCELLREHFHQLKATLLKVADTVQFMDTTNSVLHNLDTMSAHGQHDANTLTPQEQSRYYQDLELMEHEWPGCSTEPFTQQQVKDRILSDRLYHGKDPGPPVSISVPSGTSSDHDGGVQHITVPLQNPSLNLGKRSNYALSSVKKLFGMEDAPPLSL